MKIGISTGYLEGYWGDWPWTPMYGGSERIVVELAAALATRAHEVTVRLPRACDERSWRGVRWIGLDAPSERYDILFCFDDFARRDMGDRSVLVACRSDPPLHANFDQLIFLSKTHAQLMGHPDRPSVGGGVSLDDYSTPQKRFPRRVICTSSPDRCPQASLVGASFDFVHSYRPVGGVGQEMDRSALIRLQQTAMAHIYPLDPVRPSDFFSMSVLESMAAGTPVVLSNADSMPELWGDVSYMIPLPVRLAEWTEAVEELLVNKRLWQRFSDLGRKKAAEYTWDLQAARYLSIAKGD